MYAVLRQSADSAAAEAIERLIERGSDQDLCRVNVLAFAAANGLNEERAIAAFLHAARIGLFELSWNVLCPSCSGVIEARTTLKNVDRAEYYCGFCAAGCEPNLDEVIEVTFTVNQRVRRIAAHDPNTIPGSQYLRQLFWSSGIDLPADFEREMEEMTLDSLELPPGEKALISLQPAGPVRHPVRSRDAWQPVHRRQGRADARAAEPVDDAQRGARADGDDRAAPWAAAHRARQPQRPSRAPDPVAGGEKLATLLARRRPFLSGKRLLTNQVFRDIYRTDTLDIDQRLKITSLTFLFTDLKGSTELYERVGDLVAFELVRAHFRALHGDRRRRGGGGGEDDRRRGHGHVSDAGPRAGRGAAHARRDAAASIAAPRGSAAQDRHSRRAVPRRGAERPPGLFRPDRQHRLARAAPGGVALDPRQRRGDRQSRVRRRCSRRAG